MDRQHDHDHDEGDREGRGGVSADAIQHIDDRLAGHGEMLKAILALLQAGASNDGPSLSKLLERLVASVDTQTKAIGALTTHIVKLRHDLPLDLVAAIDDNLDIPRRNGRGEEGGLPS